MVECITLAITGDSLRRSLIRNSGIIHSDLCLNEIPNVTEENGFDGVKSRQPLLSAFTPPWLYSDSNIVVWIIFECNTCLG